MSRGARSEHRIEADWYAFREFSPQTVRRARAWYLRFMPTPGALLDIGCGRGEFLAAAAHAGHEELGLDQEGAMLAEAGELPVVETDAFEFLQSTPDQYDTITAFHVVEHLSVREVSALIGLSADRLTPGGRLIVATPNPGSFPMMAHEFWRDPTHRRPYDVELLEFLTVGAGLVTESAGVNPESDRGLPVDLDDLELDEPSPSADARVGPDPRASRWVAGQLERSSYGQGLERAIHAATDGLQHTREELARVAGVLHKFLEVAFEPSEVYVVARRA